MQRLSFIKRVRASLACIAATDYSPSVKPWILPEFEGLVRNGEIKMEFNAAVTEITPDTIKYRDRRRREGNSQ